MLPRDYHDRIRGEFASGKSLDEVLAGLRTDGASILECIMAVHQVQNCGLAEAKRKVHFSPVWADARKANEEFHQKLEAEVGRMADEEETARRSVGQVVKIFRSNPDASDDEIVQKAVNSGIVRPLAIQLVAILPIAYGRVTLPEVKFSDMYVCLDENGEDDRGGHLGELPAWPAALAFAKQDLEPTFPLASRSPEIKIANQALNDGKKLDALVWSQPNFIWPVDGYGVRRGPFSIGAHALSFTPLGLTQADRKAEKITMIVALIIGAIIVVGLAIYALPLLRSR